MDDETDIGDKKRRRTLAGTLLHHYAPSIACLAFSLSTASFLVYHLGFFSTFLIYLPFATVCVPGLAIYDGFHISSWARWTTLRRMRFRVSVVWCLCLVFAPRYPSSSPLSSGAPIPPVIPSTSNATYFITANLYNSAKVLPSWMREMELLIDHIGRQNVFISVYESNSKDGTQDILRNFEIGLNEAGVKNKIVVEGGTRGVWGLNSEERIAYMAEIRNKALEPLRVMGDTEGSQIDKVLFFNDIFFDWRSIVRLINTRDGDYDLVCALDFDGVGMYDTWVLRDACGRPTKEVWPYVSSDAHAVNKLRNGEAFEVASCWNGVVSFDASWFLSNSTKGKPSTNVPPFPLQFRQGDECTSSECYLIGLDMHFWTAPLRPKIYVNPQVRVAYESLNYLFHTKLEYLTVSKPWRWIWQDLIGYRLFGWWSDRLWMKEDRCAGKHGSLKFVEADYCRM